MSNIAIIGAQCRFPGNAPNPDAFFDSITQPVNFVGDIPADRWNSDKFFSEADSAGKAYVRRGHFLDYGYEFFDALAFGMAPREVEFIDPQQRLLLETTWQAFENAGVDIAALSGRNVGVYVGGFTVDHLINQFAGRNRGAIGAHSAAGATLTMLANRVSYAFNLTGPSLSVDTACSSSLVAFTLAVNDLRAGRCEMAVVGGVNFILRPEYVIAMCKGRFLARDGRSKSFDASADGYGRGEGCGVIVLKRAEDAEADGDDIVAYVDGAGVNQDGRTPGITVPNPKAQEALMRQVLRESGVDAASILYVEAHGTGTPVGDPLEAAAIASVYGAAERDAPVVIGSVKSNIGHLEAAAGVAGVIKAAWMLRRNLIPPLASLETPNPALPLHDGRIALATELRPLGDPDKVRRIAVNSFGYGGANAHVILRSTDPQHGHAHGTSHSHGAAHEHGRSAPAHMPMPDVLLAPASARSARALPAAAAALAGALRDEDAEGALFTAARRRAHFEHRAVAWGTSAGALADGLDAIARGEKTANALQGEALIAPAGGTVFVYTGMGPQWWGMGRGLWQSSRVYREALEEADALFRPLAGFSILEEMLRGESESRIERTEFAQPANFLLQMGLTRALAAEGIRPDAVVGHSVGEVSSAWASGMLPLEQALLVSRHRSRVQAKAAGQGGMLAVGLDEEQAEDICAASSGAIDIAAINAPGAVTLSGDAGALRDLAARLEDQGIFARMLTVEVPYHSAYMDPLKDELIDSLSGLTPTAPDVALYSTVTGRRVETKRFDGEYWADNVRDPVRFMAAIRRLLDDGYTHFVEVGPRPVLSRSLLDVFKAAGAQARHIPTLTSKEDDVESFRRSVASAYVAGVPLDWASRHPIGRTVPLPNYPFARERLWREAETQRHDRLGFGSRAFAQERIQGGPQIADLTAQCLSFLHDHRVAGAAVAPGAAYLEALLDAAEAAFPDSGAFALDDVRIEAALVLDRERAQVLEVTRDGQLATVTSRDDVTGGDAVRHATATPRPVQGPSVRSVVPADLWALAPIEEPAADAYARFRQMGLDYGEAFRPIVRLAHDAERRVAVAALRLPARLIADAARYIAHPSLIDGAFQAALALLEPGEGAYLPVGIAELRVLRAVPQELIVRVDLVTKDADRLLCDLTLHDADGVEVVTIRGFACAALTPARRDVTLPEADYIDQWDDVPALQAAHDPAPLVIVAPEHDRLADTLAAHAAEDGRLRRLVRWSEPALYETLQAATIDTGVKPCVAMLFDAGIGDRSDAAAGVDVRRLHGALIGFSSMRQMAPRLVVVTRGAQPVGGRMVPQQAATFGFARVAYSELDELSIDSVDLDPDHPDLDALLTTLSAPVVERESALRDGRRLAPVLRASGVFAARPTIRARPADTAVGLEAAGLCERRLPPEPAAGTLRVAFEAVAMTGEASPTLGFVGRVVAAGTDATGARIGARIAGLTASIPSARQSTADLSADGLILTDWPEPLAADAGAAAVLTQPSASALEQRLRLPAGARALVVGSPLGKALAARLRASGIVVTLLPADPDLWTETALDRGGGYALIAAPLADWSRRFGFGRWLAAEGALVDLATDAVPFAVPAQAGLVLRPVAPTDPAAIVSAIESSREFAPALVASTPLAAWRGAGSGFAVAVIDSNAPVEAAADLRPVLRRDGTYLVTGGFGALGGQSALWLAANGAGRVAVAGRRGADTPGASELLAQIEALGAEAVPVALDTADAAAVEAAIASLHRPDAPLRGVLHAAGALSDKPILEMDEADIATAMRAKVVGALALDRATRGRDLDLFVTYSSIAVTVGNRRQANYVAANAVMDSLAHARRAAGLPALSVNFGAISEIGMAADPMVEAHLRQIGLPPVAPGIALAGVGAALHAGIPQLAASAALDWARTITYDPRAARTTRLREFCGPHLARLDGGRAAAIKAQLAGAPHAQRVEAMAGLLGEIVTSALKLDLAALTPLRPLEEVGVDSLLAVEIQLAIETAIGINVSTMLLIGRATLTSVAESVLSQMGLTANAEPVAAAGSGTELRIAAE